MSQRQPPSAFTTARDRIASRVRELRQARGWTLEQLALRLHISKTRLSEIERGGGSFTAEQLLVMLRIFNVPVTDFTEAESTDRSVEIQNALARLGARHLHESTAKTPSESLYEDHETIGAAIIDGSPRLVAAIAPALVRNIDRLNLSRLHANVAALGHQARLGWIVDNTLFAIDELLRNDPRDVQLLEARLKLTNFAERLRAETAARSAPEDILDSTIRTQATLDAVRRTRSRLAEEWNIVTVMQPEDFLKATRAALAAN